MPAEPDRLLSSAAHRLVLLEVDPYWIVSYWMIQPRAVELARSRLGCPDATTTLRFYEGGHVESEGPKAPETFDIDVGETQGNYYVSLLSPGKSLIAEYGVRSEDGRFVAIVRSNQLQLPMDSESPRYDDTWSLVGGKPGVLWKSRARGEAPPGVPDLPAVKEDEAQPVDASGGALARKPEAATLQEATPVGGQVAEEKQEVAVDRYPVARTPPGRPAASAPRREAPPAGSPSPVPVWRESIGVSSGPVQRARPSLDGKEHEA